MKSALKFVKTGMALAAACMISSQAVYANGEGAQQQAGSLVGRVVGLPGKVVSGSWGITKTGAKKVGGAAYWVYDHTAHLPVIKKVTEPVETHVQAHQRVYSVAAAAATVAVSYHYAHNLEKEIARKELDEALLQDLDVALQVLAQKAQNASDEERAVLEAAMVELHLNGKSYLERAYALARELNQKLNPLK